MAQSLHGMPPYLPPGQLTALHPFVMHQQGVPHNVNAHLVQYWQSQQVWENIVIAVFDFQFFVQHFSDVLNFFLKALSDGSQVPSHEHPSQNDPNLPRSETNYDHISQGTESHPVVPTSNFVGQVKYCL